MTEPTLLMNGATRLFGIVGHPIAQALSPAVMTARLRAAGRNAVLVPMHVLPDGFEATMRALMAMPNLDGLVVTVPYKARAMTLMDRVGPHGTAVGAVNALRRATDGRWEGDMFDGLGLVRALQAAGFPLPGATVSILGAGGAGSAVAVALADAGARRLRLHDTDPARAAALARRVAGHRPACDVSAGTDPADVAGCTLLVNCTPVGMNPGDGMPARFGPLPPGLFVMDIVTHDTPLGAHARHCGCRTLDGAAMLQGQADALMDYFAVSSSPGSAP